jgi:hypothetical protein
MWSKFISLNIKIITHFQYMTSFTTKLINIFIPREGNNILAQGNALGHVILQMG